MTMQARCNSQSADKLHKFYKICLDNGSQVNIIDLQRLSNLRTQDKVCKIMGGISKTTRVGYSDGHTYRVRVSQYTWMIEMLSSHVEIRCM